MEVKLEITYNELLKLIKQLPPHQLKKLQKDIKKEGGKIESTAKDVSEFQKLLLSGPVMSKKGYVNFLENRKNFSAWRKK